MDFDTSALKHIVAEMNGSGTSDEAVRRALKACDIVIGTEAVKSVHHTPEKEAQLLVEACDLLGDVTFAARSGLSFRVESTLNDFIGKYSKDLRSAIEQTSRFHEVDSPAIGWGLRVSGNSASLELFWKDASLVKFHRYAEFLMFSTLAKIRSLTQIEVHPYEIRFAHNLKSSNSKLNRLAGCQARFDSEDSEIILPLAALSLPIPTYDPRLQELLSDYGERLLNERRHPRETLRSKVEGLLVAALPSRMLTADEVAASVGMSRRSFDRRLKEQGFSYREISDDLRCGLAKALMQDEMSFIEIAFALGYADQAAFSTAFKRWTGVAPSAYRTRHDEQSN